MLMPRLEKITTNCLSFASKESEREFPLQIATTECEAENSFSFYFLKLKQQMRNSAKKQ